MTKFSEDVWDFAEAALAVASVIFVTWLIVFFVEHAK